jgi:hypothetical protein
MLLRDRIYFWVYPEVTTELSLESTGVIGAEPLISIKVAACSHFNSLNHFGLIIQREFL